MRPPTIYLGLKVLWLKCRLARMRRKRFAQLRDRSRLRAEKKALLAKHYDERQSILFQQIGLIASGWAIFEMSLDSTIQLIHRHGGNSAIQPDLPASLKPKLAYLRKAPRSVLALAALQDAANTLSARAQVLKETRHDCLHGMMVMDPRDYAVWFVRFQYEADKLRVREVKRTQDEITDAAKATASLYRASVRLFGLVSYALDDEQAIKGFSQLQVGLASIPVEEED